MTNLGACLFGTCCGVGYLPVSVFLGVTLVFLFINLVSAVSDALENYLEKAEPSALSGGAS
ncbi:MAG: hypothetical protein E4H03_12870, partial [Myxococcales bacterium]